MVLYSLQHRIHPQCRVLSLQIVCNILVNKTQSTNYLPLIFSTTCLVNTIATKYNSVNDNVGRFIMLTDEPTK